jgi:hypothetical protein
MQILLYAAALLLVLLVPQHAAAQTLAGADSAAVAAAMARASQQYRHTVQPESGLYNGPEYVNYVSPGTIGHQFFLQPEAQLGSIAYSGATFQQVPLSYDLVRDRVVLTYPSQAVTVALVSEKVASFTMSGHQFVRLATDSARRGELPTGFYELLLPGPVSLLARHTKKLNQTTVQQNLRLEFRQTDKLFARTTSAFEEITSLKKLVAVLPTHKAEVQHYARLHKLGFSTADRETSAVSLLRYYYTLQQ